MRSGSLFLMMGLVLFQAVAPSQTAGICDVWTDTAAGRLDVDPIREASGLEVSRSFADRLYHVNDSGDSGRFFVTALDGTGTRAIAVEGFDPVDVEDLALGPCGAGDGDCLFIADIGDNQARRPSVEIVLVREPSETAREVAPERRIRVRYPDGPHDAESLAIHPNLDLFILTKAPDYGRLSAGPSVLYRIPYRDWSRGGEEARVAARVGEIALSLISSDPFSGSLPTAMDISDDLGRLLLLTYRNAFEFRVDLSGPAFPPLASLVEGVDYREILLAPLAQQESIAWLPPGDGFLYTTEAGAANPGAARLVALACSR